MSGRSISMLGACALVLGLGACGSEIVEKVEAMADRACQCRDTACADTVERQFYEFAQANTRVQGTQGERDEIQEHHDRMRQCLIRVRSAPGAAAGQGEAGAAEKDEGAGQAGEKEKSQ
jgi:hypothetical protein